MLFINTEAECACLRLLELAAQALVSLMPVLELTSAVTVPDLLACTASEQLIGACGHLPARTAAECGGGDGQGDAQLFKRGS